MSTTYSPLATAIAQAEGFGKEGAIPTIANNPGDLNLGDQGLGTLGQGVTVFPSLEAGWAALENQVSAMTSGSSSYYSPDMTIEAAGQTYANGDSNWANNVASALGVTPQTTLAQANSSSSSSTSSGLLSAANSAFSMTGIGSTLSGIFGGFNLEDGVIIIVGIILVAAGAFSFKGTQTVIQTATKYAKKGAEVVG